MGLLTSLPKGAWPTITGSSIALPRRWRQGRASQESPSGVIAQVALRKTVVGLRLPRARIGAEDRRLPSLVGEDLQPGSLRLEKQSRKSAAGIAETVATEIPDKDGDAILSLPQERSDVHLVIIGVSGSRATLEATLEHDQRVIDPEPVLGVGATILAVITSGTSATVTFFLNASQELVSLRYSFSYPAGLPAVSGRESAVAASKIPAATQTIKRRALISQP